jgi:hypothetical protein
MRVDPDDHWWVIRDRIMSGLGWSRSDATIAARYIRGAETDDDLKERTQYDKPSLGLVRAYDIRALADRTRLA